MIPKSTFQSLDDLDGSNFHIPGSHKQMGNWSSQGLQDDGVWITTAGFTIFTMISGFGLLESGRVSSKDEVNIMVKNVIDVIMGGLAYWCFGFGLSFGSWDAYLNPYVGVGDFFFDPVTEDENTEGWTFASFIYQMSFATRTSAIVSAGMCERVHLRSYIIVSFVMTLVHAIPAHWVWSDAGIMWQWGVIDFAGCSVVHLVGGIAGLVSTLFLKPRHDRFGKNAKKQLSNPTNATLGCFMVWWGWLAFNTGSTYGVSHGKWKLAARSAVNTILCSFAGGMAAFFMSLFQMKNIQIDMIIDGLLAALVASSASCPCVTTWQSVLIGHSAAILALSSVPLLEWAQIDDPVGVVPVHVIGAMWGMVATGLFAADDPLNYEVTRRQNGLLYNGGFQLLLIQLQAVAVVSIWSAVITFTLLFLLQHSPMGLRLSLYEEQLGADLREHGLQGQCVKNYRINNKLSAETATRVMMMILKWKSKAKRRTAAKLLLNKDEFELKNMAGSTHTVLTDKTIETS